LKIEISEHAAFQRKNIFSQNVDVFDKVA